MSKKPSYKNGFTLVELMVTIAIISVVSITSVVGFNRLGETLRLKQSIAFIADSVTLAEQKVLRQEAESIEIIFGELEFNLDPEGHPNEFQMTTGANSKVVIEAPYSKKTFYDESDNQIPEVLITLQNADGSASESITLK